MSEEEDRNEFEIITGEKKHFLKLDCLNKEIELAYPKLKDSKYFWDMVSAFMKSMKGTNINKIKSKEDINKETVSEIIDSELIEKTVSNLVPTITKYLLHSIELQQGKQTSDEFNDKFFLCVSKNIDYVIKEMTSLINDVLPAAPEGEKKNILGTTQ